MSAKLQIASMAPLLAGVFAGGLLQGFTGFGFALAAVPLISLFLPPTQVLPYVMALQAALGLASLPGAWSRCHWRLLGWLTLGVAAGTPVGLWAIAALSPAAGRLGVGLAVLTAFAVLATGARIPMRRSRLAATGAGVAAGVMNGLAGMSGPPAVALVVAAEMKAEEARATLMVFVFGAALAALAPMGLAGELSPRMAMPLLAALPALGVSWLLGSALFRRTSEARHRQVALGVLGLLALATIVRAAIELLGR
ncbi:MAG: sulfite exporter TauE/SafE family protein [Caulobacteraceae bacterium]|nr:sulfite exporter TauE/SafE family protein [Caulobacteraceae bacterium]